MIPHQPICLFFVLAVVCNLIKENKDVHGLNCFEHHKAWSLELKFFEHTFVHTLCWFPWTQDVNWMYIRRSEDVQNMLWTPHIYSVYVQNVNWMYMRRSVHVLDVYWTSYVRSIYVLCPGGLFKDKEFIKILFKIFDTSSNICCFKNLMSLNAK